MIYGLLAHRLAGGKEVGVSGSLQAGLYVHSGRVGNYWSVNLWCSGGVI